MRARRDTPPRAARVRHRAHLEVASHRVTNHRWKRRLPVGDVFVPLPTTPRVWPAGQPAGDHRSTRAPAALHQTTTHIPSGYPGLCPWPSGDVTLPRYVTGFVQRRQLQRAMRPAYCARCHETPVAGAAGPHGLVAGPGRERSCHATWGDDAKHALRTTDTRTPEPDGGSTRSAW